MQHLDSTLIAQMFGEDVTSLEPICRQILERSDLSYRILDGDDRDEVLRNCVVQLNSSLPIAGPARAKEWEKGWSNNYQDYLDSRNPASLLPKYYRNVIRPMRFSGDFILPNASGFEVNILAIIQQFLAVKFVSTATCIYEFGCGPGHNLLAFSDNYPEKKYVGLDWAKSSQTILSSVSTIQQIDLQGIWFDMFEPDTSIKLDSGGVVFTIGSMEQLGTAWQKFFSYIWNQDVRKVVHIEPIVELHDPNNLMDYLGILYMKKRGYLSGYLTFLKELASQGRIEINDSRVLMGSENYYGWNLVTWNKTV